MHEINGALQKLEATRRLAMTRALSDTERLEKLREHAKAIARRTVFERKAVTEADLDE